MSFAIYQITNILSGHHYIGFTIQNPVVKRWKEHQYLAKIGSNTHFHKAIRKYGAESFVCSILEEGWDPKIGKNIREPYWISVLKPEYNETAGGEGLLGFAFSKASRLKMIESHKGQIPWNKGISPSIDHRYHVSVSKMGKILGPQTELHRKHISDGQKLSHASSARKPKRKKVVCQNM